MPFDGNGGYGGGEDSASRAGPRRLPSLSMEAFAASKRREGLDARREGVESRCSDPGVRGSSCGESRDRRRRRAQERPGGGAVSAPSSRGDQVSASNEQWHFPDPPNSEPHGGHNIILGSPSCPALHGAGRGRASRSPLFNRGPYIHTPASCVAAESRGPYIHTPASGVAAESRGPYIHTPASGVAIDSTSSPAVSGRPPVPRVRKMASRERRGMYPSDAEPLPLAPASLVAAASASARGEAGDNGDADPGSSRRHDRRASTPTITRSPSSARLQRTLQRPPRHAGEEEPRQHQPDQPDVERAAASESRAVPAQPSLAVGLPRSVSMGALAGATESLSPTSAVAALRSPPGTVEAQFGGLLNVQSGHDSWDQDSSQSFGVTGSKGSRPLTGSRRSKLTCSRGPRGITSLSMELSTADEQPTMTATASSNLGGDRQRFDNPAVVRGVRSWVPGEVIGHGSLGSVFKALDHETGQLIAVKEVRIDRKDDSDMKFKNALENEVEICKELEHPHIVKYLGHDYIKESLYIYLEFMPGGSLAQVLSQFGPFDESLIAAYARELLEGLEYLHTREPRVLHRDIKGANILVGLDCKVKLTDFGCSKRTADTMSQSLRGSIPWMAPEVIQQTGYGRRSDVWSLGCVIIEMATARHPWGSFDNPMAAMVKIGMSDSTPPIPENLSETCRDLIRLCTQRDKEKRPLAGTLLLHDFVRDATAPAY